MASKGTYANDEEKERWYSIMKMEIMSSEESGEEDGDEVIILHPIPWLSAEITAFKQKLDAEIKKEKTPQARRQTKRRVIGSPSSRVCPNSVPAWAKV